MMKGFMGLAWISSILIGAVPVIADEDTSKFDGRFWVILETDTKFAPGGIVCAGARGHLEVRNGNITGTLISDFLMDFEVSGLIDHNGYVTGGMAITPTSSEIATFGDTDVGSGTWSYLGCHGNERSWKVPDNPDPTTDLLTRLNLRENLCANTVFLECLNIDKESCEYTYDEAAVSCQTLNSTLMIDLAATAQLMAGCIVNRQVQDLPVEPQAVNTCLARAAPTAK